MINVTIIGAGGRMGKTLIKCVLEDSQMSLSGAIEYSQSPLIGKNAGLQAGTNETNINISANIDDVLQISDAVIDFSSATTAIENAEKCFNKNVSYVLGSTGLTQEQKVDLLALTQKGAKIVFAPNMSVGVNLLFYLCSKVPEILGDNYDIEVVEMHHKMKKDAPSGTAERMAEILAHARALSYEENITHGRFGMVGERPANEIGVHALRGGDVVGDHTVIFATEGERVELTHKASSRDTFAKGALRAVKFLVNAQQGLYDMQDVLGLK